MSRRSLALAARGVLLGLPLVSTACPSESAAPSPAASASAPSPAEAAPVASPVASASGSTSPSAPRETIPGDIAVAELDAEIRAFALELTTHRDDLALGTKLAARLLTRATHLGVVEDYETAWGVAEEAVRLHPDEVGAHVLRAEVLAALRRFDEADAELSVATEKGRMPDVSTIKLAILTGRGQLQAAVEVAHGFSHRRPDLHALGVYAAALGRVGRVDEADAHFREAQESYRDPSPFPLAGLHFAWGAMWERRGDAERAMLHFRRARERLPDHAGATAHLSALVAPEEGIALLTPMVERATHPEVLALLGRLEDATQKGRGQPRVALARARFDALVSAHPLAFAEPATRFWLTLGEAAKARRLSLDNLRATPGSADALALFLDALGTATPTSEECLALVGTTPASPMGTGADLDDTLRARRALASARCGGSRP